MDFLNKYNISIKNQKLLETALTHSSYAYENNLESYERLEFLGDAVLEIVMSEYLYLNTDMAEGGLSKKRASYVCESALARYADDINLKDYIKVGHGQENKINDTIVADVLESVLAAIYLDQGLEVVKKFIYDLIIPYVQKEITFFGDYKSILQELVQTGRKSLEYIMVGESGPAHDKHFIVNVLVDGIVYGTGEGHSKKEAEQKAALDAINKEAK